MQAKRPAPDVSPDEAHDGLGHEQRCPLCARDNQCRVARGELYKGACWCHQVILPGHILTRLAEDTLDPACFCRPCLETIAKISRESDSTEQILAAVRKAVLLTRPDPSAQPGPDYYLDANGNTVFTAAYHLKRGTCCENQCRHCPY